jgi:8-amino-7-oxononanoate synthase
LVTALGLEDAVLARVVTFGKALGSQGAAVIGPAVLRDYLLNFSRPFIYTTALPPLTIAGLAAAYDLLPTLHAERAHLFALSGYLRQQLTDVPGLELPAHSHVIHPVRLPSATPAQVRSVAAGLQQAGFDARAIVPPTVPAGQQCLRVIVHAHNTVSEIDAFLVALRAALRFA